MKFLLLTELSLPCQLVCTHFFFLLLRKMKCGQIIINIVHDPSCSSTCSSRLLPPCSSPMDTFTTTTTATVTYQGYKPPPPQLSLQQLSSLTPPPLLSSQLSLSDSQPPQTNLPNLVPVPNIELNLIQNKPQNQASDQEESIKEGVKECSKRNDNENESHDKLTFARQPQPLFPLSSSSHSAPTNRINNCANCEVYEQKLVKSKQQLEILQRALANRQEKLNESHQELEKLKQIKDELLFDEKEKRDDNNNKNEDKVVSNNSDVLPRDTHITHSNNFITTSDSNNNNTIPSCSHSSFSSSLPSSGISTPNSSFPDSPKSSSNNSNNNNDDDDDDAIEWIISSEESFDIENRNDRNYNKNNFVNNVDNRCILGDFKIPPESN